MIDLEKKIQELYPAYKVKVTSEGFNIVVSINDTEFKFKIPERGNASVREISEKLISFILDYLQNNI